MVELTRDQQTALGEIMRVAGGHRRRPLVITADRGRGKSSVLGIASAELLLQEKQRIVVTAPSPNAVEPLFRHAARTLSNYRHGKNRLYHDEKSITFVAPDELIHNPVSADLLVVDEAAAIPAPLLQRLLEHYSRIVFSTTVHGYEGTGRGFAIRFKSILDRLTPDWHSLKMNEPVRWADDDPLEKLVFSALLLDAEAAEDKTIAGEGTAQLRFERFTREALIANEQLLREVFGLLVSAHYRTRPFDLRYLLDGPNVRIWCAMAGKSVAGVAITVREGGFNEEMAAKIRSGSRRPRGHLVPQQLAVHCALDGDLEHDYLRIMRIAVHPALRRKNIGSKLLAHMANNKRTNEILCTSFGATPGLLDFWRKNDFEPVRVGLKREASSGAHSVIMLKKEDHETAFYAAARARFSLTLPLLLTCELHQLEPEIVTSLNEGLTAPLDTDKDDSHRLKRFAAGELPLDAALPELVRLAEQAVSDGTIELMDKTEADVFVAILLQRKTMKEVAEACGLNGQREVQDLLRKIAGLEIMQSG